MNDDRDSWLTLCAGPYFGTALYGKDTNPVKAGNYFNLARKVDNALSFDWKLNSLYMSPWELRHDVRRSASIFRMKRGKSWDKTFEQLGDVEASIISMSHVPSSKIKACEFSFLSAWPAYYPPVCPISYLALGGLWNSNEPLFTDEYCRVFLVFLREALRFTQIDYGFLQLYMESCMDSVRPHKKRGRGAFNLKAVPLISEIADSRYDGEFSKRSPSAWQGEPCNLYWGNVVHQGFADSLDLENFLIDEAELELVEIEDTIPAKACVGKLSEGFLFFCLSGDINDSLCPDKRYEDRYKLILKYLLDKKAIYPGLG